MKLKCIFYLIALFGILSCKKETLPNSKIASSREDVKTHNSDTIQGKNNPESESQINNRNNLRLFRIMEISENEKIHGGLISLSDVYPLSEKKDSFAIPNGKSNLKYFKLSDIYRQRLLTKTNISESDSVFIYDYSKNNLISFPVKKLNTIAYLDVYSDVSDCPCDQNYYMIGFEVPKAVTDQLGDALVFIGKQSPFIKGQMKAVIWKKINFNQFPLAKSHLKKSENKGNAYFYESGKYDYYVNDYKVKITEDNNSYEKNNRHLMILDSKSGNFVTERFFEDNEGSEPSLLNFGISDPNNPYVADIKNQWTGALFKHYPDVIFGLEDFSFGCPNIIFIDPLKKDISINCDNRH